MQTTNANYIWSAVCSPFPWRIGQRISDKLCITTLIWHIWWINMIHIQFSGLVLHIAMCICGWRCIEIWMTVSSLEVKHLKNHLSSIMKWCNKSGISLSIELYAVCHISHYVALHDTELWVIKHYLVLVM